MTDIRHRILAAMGLAGALLLGGCAYDDGYGYGGVSVGTGYYGQSGYYQPGLYNGWYDNYYYPGTGYYVYDRGGRRQRWNDGQRRYWEGRRVERQDDRRNGQWEGRDRQPGNGNWTNRPRPSQGTDAPRGRGNWRGNDAVRPTPQRQPQDSPQMNQPRPQRDWGTRTPPAARPERAPRWGGRDSASRVRPN